MELNILPNGNLRIALTDTASRDLIKDLLDTHGDNDTLLLANLLEDTGWQPNGRLHLVAPEQISALTDAPIVADELGIADDGTVDHVGKVWWYPSYMLKNFARVLLEDGSVVFTAAPENVH